MSTQCLSLFPRSPTLHVESPLQKEESRLKLRSVDTRVDPEIEFFFFLFFFVDF